MVMAIWEVNYVLDSSCELEFAYQVLSCDMEFWHLEFVVSVGDKTMKLLIKMLNKANIYSMSVGEEWMQVQSKSSFLLIILN